jgi:hypothetical protein
MRAALAILWICAFVAVPFWIAADHVGWDVAIYHHAIRSLQLHHDPYWDAIAIQDAFHRTLAFHPNATTPFSYVYSPITLPLLRLIGALPVSLTASLYWILYVFCALSLVWVGLQLTQPREHQPFLFIAPAVLFFPGLLQHDAILSGNVAVILYGFVLAAAVLGWRSGKWSWCYLAILLASCFKPPLLSLLAIPLFSARRQLLPTAITAAAGGALLAMQPLVCPSLFHNFLHAIELQFTYNRDFGCSPAGLVSNLLVAHGIPYSPAGTLIYFAYALPLFALLWYLSREFLAARFTLQQWIPVLLVGVILLNPRIMQYDVLPLTLPMALIGWRSLSRVTSRPVAILIFCAVLAPANLFAVQTLDHWKTAEGTLLVVVFAAGCWDLLHWSPSFRADKIAAQLKRQQIADLKELK